MNREEFIENVKSTQKQLRLFLLGLTGDAQLADDLAQDALLKAYLASSRYNPRHKFSTWLLKIAYNTYLDHCKLYHERNKSPLPTHPPALGKGATPGTHSTATHPGGTESDLIADSTFRYQELYMALDALSEKERFTIMLHYIYGYAVKEISEIMKESESAVKKQLQRAREALHAKLTR